MDLSNEVFFFPSRLAMRRFLALLADHAMREELTIEAPHVRNVGEFPELLYEQKYPFASALTQQVAWVTALQKVQRQDPQHFKMVFPYPPANDDLLGWLQLDEQLVDMYQELARETVDFEEVSVICGRLERQQAGLSVWEKERWKLLAAVQEEYHKVLDQYHVWDRQSARLFALKQSNPQKDFHVGYHLNLVGCVDLNQILRKFVARVQNQVEVFVFAPESMADRFEPDGCLKTEAWQELDPELSKRLEANLAQVSTPADQADYVAHWIREQRVKNRFSTDEIAIGMPDASLEPYLVQALGVSGVSPSHAAKKNVEMMQPWRLLELLMCCLRDMKRLDKPDQADGSFVTSISLPFDTFAQLVRHADMERYFLRRHPELRDWVKELDLFYNRFLPDTVQYSTILRGHYPSLLLVFTMTAALLDRMISQYEHFGHFLTVISEALKEVYCGGREFRMEDESDFQIIRSCSELNITITEKMQIPLAMLRWMPISLVDAMQIMLTRTADRPVMLSNVSESIAMYGWLDIALDDAPVMAVAGMNEGVVPETINEHVFLPNQLREALGIKSNDSRFARDMYILSSLLASKKQVFFTFGRVSADDTPLLPSRLLLTGNAKDVAARGARYFAAPEERPTVPRAVEKELTGSVFTLPEIPADLPPISHMSVSSFSDYIACPYLFYLKHVQRLQHVDDEAGEMNEARFGTLAHAVLQRFGEAEIEYQKEHPETAGLSLEAETERIEKSLRGFLDAQRKQEFVYETQAVVSIQCEQLWHRLKAFAAKQAERNRDGWKILCVEKPFALPMREDGGQGELLDFGDGLPMLLKGTIDRIDFHPTAQQWIIWDYKTSDKKKTPEERHHRKTTKAALDTPDVGNWKDLQLPLYLQLVAAARQTTEPEYAPLRQMLVSGTRAGYILLPKKVVDVGFYMAKWTLTHLRSAWTLAEDIARKVRQKQFPVDLENLEYDTDYDWMLGR